MADRKYDPGKEPAAVSRHRSATQTVDSLEEYRAKGGRTDCLRVPKHPPQYQRMDRILPGALFSVDGERKVMTASSGTHRTKEGPKPDSYIFTDGSQATPSHCKLLRKNTGLVYI